MEKDSVAAAFIPGPGWEFDGVRFVDATKPYGNTQIHARGTDLANLYERAANSHADLVEALRAIQGWLLCDGPIKDDGITHPAFVKANNLACAALKRAEGK